MTAKIWIFALGLMAGGAPVARATAEEETLLEGVIVEAPFDIRLELPRASSVQALTESMRLQSESERALELKIAQRSPLTTLLDLTSTSRFQWAGARSAWTPSSCKTQPAPI